MRDSWVSYSEKSSEQVKYQSKKCQGFPGGSMVKNPPANVEDAVSIFWLGRSPGRGNGNPLQHSSLENPMDRVAWWVTIHTVTERLT